MLAVPGALVALGLAYLAALGTAERDRRELALLRSRGARRRDLLVLAAVESADRRRRRRRARHGDRAGCRRCARPTVPRLSAAAASPPSPRPACCSRSPGALAARLAVTSARCAATIAERRRSTPRREEAALAAALPRRRRARRQRASIYWLTARTGFSAIVNPDSNPTLSLVRVHVPRAGAAVDRGGAAAGSAARPRSSRGARRTRRRATPPPGWPASCCAASAAAARRSTGARHRRAAARVRRRARLFTATYDQQALRRRPAHTRRRRRRHSAAGRACALRSRRIARRVPGVPATTAIDHAYAYVGPDLQDTFGIDPATIGSATTLRDSYFLGVSAAEVLAPAAHHTGRHPGLARDDHRLPLELGDLLKLRVLDQRDRQVPGRAVPRRRHRPGVPVGAEATRSWSTNLAYLEQVTHESRAERVYRRARQATPPRSPHASPTARAVRRDRQEHPRPGAADGQLDHHRRPVAGSAGSRRCSRSRSRLPRSALFVDCRARRAPSRARDDGRARRVAPRGRPRSCGARSPSSLTARASCLPAVSAGCSREMLVAMLQHVFDPPPDHLAVPWLFLGALWPRRSSLPWLPPPGSIRTISRMPLGAILREE